MTLINILKHLSRKQQIESFARNIDIPNCNDFPQTSFYSEPNYEIIFAISAFFQEINPQFSLISQYSKALFSLLKNIDIIILSY